MRQHVATALNHTLNFLFPPQCLQCGVRVAVHGGMCAGCWNSMTFITPPLCPVCGIPFEYEVGGEALCGDCQRELPSFARARAVFCYDDASRRLIFRLKYHDQTALAATLGPWLALAGKELAGECDLIVPVPLHYRRYLRRRYNQAALLADIIAREGKACLPDALLRVRATPQQTGLTRREREANVQDAFAVNPRFAGRIRRSRVLLVDDVYTTGATLKACARVLLEAGAGHVCVLTLARRV